jgi:glutamate dehydrogenase (NAD(P)+)
MISTLEALKKLNMDVKKVTAAIQGFGNVGSHAAILLNKQGIQINAISDHTAAFYNEKGINITDALDYVKNNGGVLKGFTGGTMISNEDLLTSKVDVLVPAAIQNVITEEVAHKIKAKLIVEGANGPTVAEADEILNQKNITVVPDILANGGGVTVSYFEWVQNKYGHYWTEDEVNAKHDSSMAAAFHEVWNNSQQYKTSMRIGSYITAVKKLNEAIESRGKY